jgi:streptogramin lyase
MFCTGFTGAALCWSAVALGERTPSETLPSSEGTDASSSLLSSSLVIPPTKLGIEQELAELGNGPAEPGAASGTGAPVVALGKGKGSSPEGSPLVEEKGLPSEEGLPAEDSLSGGLSSAKEEGSSPESSSSKGSSPEGSPSAEEIGGSSLLGSPLVTLGSPNQAEQVQAQKEAKLTTQEAVAEREASRTKYENLSTEQAAKVAGEAFPAVIAEPAGGPPRLPAGQSITGFLTNDVAQVDLGEGKHGVIESLAPMALQTPSGRVPVDLGLTDVGNAFEPKTPVVDVRIPKRLGEGVQAPGSSLSVTPIGQGSSLGGSEGTADGAAVFFGNTQTDSDTIVKPSTLGFTFDTLLRSVESPGQLLLRVGLPEGATLVQAGNGAVQVVKEGVTIATVPAPSARDAAGTAVPVSMSVSGTTLTLTIDRSSGEFEYPIEVDPEFNVTTESSLSERAWLFESHGSGFTHGASGEMWLGADGEGSSGQWGELYYRTNGDSRIYQVNTETSVEPTEVTNAEYFIAPARIYLELEGSGGYENSVVIAQEEVPVEAKHQICPPAGCASSSGTEHNLVRIGDVLTANGAGDQVRVSSATVSISQPKETHATVSYNTGSTEIDGKANVFYGAGGWIGPNTGAFEFKMKDLGLGVAERKFEWYENGGWTRSAELEQGLKKYLGTPSCVGVQCAESQTEALDYANLYHLMDTPNGETKIRVSADDAMEHTWSSEHGESGEEVLKIDKTPPHGLKLSGVPSKGEDFELGEVEAHLKVEATDGEGSVSSSGIKSITLGLDGKELGKASGSCSVPKGECTATGEWSLNGAELGVGTYTLTAVATDNADNVETKQFTLNVYHASPVAMGPGSVNPESGDFALGATDVDMSGGAGGLALSRHYDSRNLQEGVEGPLGPQWSASLGSLASLEVLPDKSVMVVGPEGLTHFSVKKAGGFEAPKGDTNLSLELNGSEYLLKDAAKGTTTKFTLPSGANSWMPTISEGPVATDTTTDTYQSVEAVTEYSVGSTWTGAITVGPNNSLWFGGAGAVNQIPISGTPVSEYQLPKHEEVSTKSLVTGPEGNVWFATVGNIKVVGKITPSGKITEYSLPGEKHEARGITVGPDGNMWFTMEGWEGSGEYIAKITPSGVITQYSVPGKATAITPGPNGEQALWFTDGSYQRIGKITTAGSITEYQLSSASPSSIVAGPDGNLWYTAAYGTASKIGKITTTGSSTEYSLPEKSSPAGITSGPDGNLWFTDGGTSKIGKITTSGSVTEYSLPEKSQPGGITTGPDGKLWFSEEQTNKIGTMTTSGRITEPVLELAPHPTATCAPKKLEKGCRALEFTYGKETTAKGEAETEWGEYKSRLMKVAFIAYNPSSKQVESKLVAEYAYDMLGRLRAEWDPRVEHSLKTVYGYDAEGHITAMTAPGQETATFTYGTIAGDASSGRLLKMTQAPAATKLWGGEAPKDTEAPKLTGTPDLGVRMSVSNGVWTNAPIAYAYQWEDCNPAGEACTSILGATNANYTPGSGDVGHTLRALVTAANGGGSVVAASATSGEVTSTIGGAVTEYALPKGSYPLEVFTGSDSNLWFTDLFTSKIGKITTSGTITEYALPEKSEPYGIAAGPDKNLWFTEDVPNKVGKITTSGTSTEYPLPSGSRPLGIVAGPDGNLWVTDYGTSKVGRITTSGTITEYSLAEKSEPWGIASGPDKNVWFTDFGTSKIGKITTSGTITEYALPSGSKPIGIAAGPEKESALWFTDYGTNKIGKITTSGTITEYALPSNSSPRDITAGPGGDLWFAEYGTSKIGKITTSGTITEYALPSGSTPYGITEGPDKNVWFTDYGTSRIGKLIPNQPEGELRTPGPGTTVDYNVPLEGTQVPDQMGTNKETGRPEPEKWGEKDDPVYATAIFPPDEPQGWPASRYQRATINYIDSQARTVNVATPSGAIGTREYNEENAVTRSLSPDSRAAALNEGCISEKECKSAEVSKLHDTESTYNTKGQLVETRGPQHTVKLVKGKEGKSEETLARNHVKYYYNEGAKEVEEKTHETYDLVTKTEDGAETTNKEEFDVRVATTSYSGQNNLGWKLREPTSTTTNPGGLNLTSTTKYEESTGNVIETKTPAGSGGDTSVAPAYSVALGTKGTGNGQFTEPRGVAIAKSGNVYVLDTANGRVEEFSASGTYLEKFGASGKEKGQLSTPYAMTVDSKGDVWIADTGNDRVDEFNEKREFLQAFGWGVSNGEEKLEVCTSSCKAGTAGAGAGQFKEPKGIAVSANGAVYVADGANNRLEEFKEKGEFVAAFGFEVSNEKDEYEICTSGCKAGVAGSGNGQFNAPGGVAIASNGNVWVADDSNNRVEEFNEKDEYLSKFGVVGSGNGQFKEPKGVAIAANGNILVADSVNDRVQELTPSGTFVTTFGAKGTGNGQFEEPWGIGLTTSGDLYVADVRNNRVQVWIPTITGNTGAHEGKTIYYTAKTEAEAETCRNHPEWVGLPCESEPVAQPGTSKLPELPVTEIEYNMWDQPETVTEKFGSTTRTKKTSYDPAGRPLSSEETASPATDTALPKITDRYEEKTGAMVEQSTTVGETTEAIKSAYNTLGQMTEYTDASGNKATFEYETEKDARLIKVKDEKGSQTYHYNETTGFMTELVDSAAGTLKAEYDVAGRMTSETYPNAMTAYYTRNQDGATTGIEYKKTAHCEKTCPEVWFSDSIVPSIHGETLQQTSTLSKEHYAYDEVGRLSETQETPAGEYCKVRLYGHDEESNRTTFTTREPNSEKGCATEGGRTEWHTYDTANRITDPGVAYETFGNTTELPASDAGGSTLTSEYYVDNQVYKQEQNGEKVEYKLDPEGRTLETISKGNTAATVVSHYDGSGGALAWTSEEAGKKWTRNIPGIGGALTAIEHSGEETKPVLQLHDLQGNIVAEAAISETETKLLKTYNSTEFGVPNGKEPPPKYSWLGAAGVASELPSGVITQDGVSYVPQTGRPLQTEGVALLAISSSATPFARPVEAWVGSKAGEGAARELAKAEQEQQERERANQPPGVIPSGNPGWWCGGEYGPCEGEGGGGGEEGGSGGGECSGINACAASVHHHEGVTEYHERGNGYAGCSVWASYGSEDMLSGVSGEIEIDGHWECQEAVTMFVLQIALLVFYEGNWVEIGPPYTEPYFDVSSSKGQTASNDFGCGPEHLAYAAWVWGAQYDGSYHRRWWGWGREAEVRTSCHGGVGLPDGPSE